MGLFPRHCADEIFQGVNLREIVNKDNGRTDFVAVDDEGVVLDMDTPEDYRMTTMLVHRDNSREKNSIHP